MKRPDGLPLVIAHRGASAYAPEHTFAAWDLAARMGADYLEQDLQMTSDGELVVLHDDTLERTLRGDGCSGRVADRTLAEIRRFDAGSWFNARFPDRADPRFADERVATLEQVLERYAGRARFYIETKKPEDAPGMEERLADILRRHGLAGTAKDGLPAVIVQSFSGESLRRMAELAPEVPRVLLLGRSLGRSVVQRIARIGDLAHGIGPDRRLVNRGTMDAARERGLAVHPYTVNEEAEMRRLLALGVDGMFTDRPDTLLQIRGG